MKHERKPVTILVADDDPDDRLLIRDALEESRLCNNIDFVEDGVELMDYLHRRGKFSDRAGSKLPGLILLDLNMPRKDGREAIKEIKADPYLRLTPVIVLTTSKAEEDILRSYDLGANSFIVKPVTFNDLVTVMTDLTNYWLQIVELPAKQETLRTP
jgi:CheY-like chemotaxis protein